MSQRVNPSGLKRWIKKNMNQNEPDKKIPDKQSVGLLNGIGMAVLGLFLLAGFVGFIKVLVTEGFSSAAKQAPGGLIVFLIIAAVAYIFTTAYLADKGHKSIARAMAWSGAAFLGFFVLTALPTCSNEGTTDPTELYYRK